MRERVNSFLWPKEYPSDFLNGLLSMYGAFHKHDRELFGTTSNPTYGVEYCQIRSNFSTLLILVLILTTSQCSHPRPQTHSPSLLNPMPVALALWIRFPTYRMGKHSTSHRATLADGAAGGLLPFPGPLLPRCFRVLGRVRPLIFGREMYYVVPR
jgi:hypothetical protein